MQEPLSQHSEKPVYLCSVSLVCFTLSWARYILFTHFNWRKAQGRTFKQHQKRVFVVAAWKFVLQM